MKYKYALITDNSLQWFSFIIALSESDDILESYHIDSKMNNEYLTNKLVKVRTEASQKTCMSYDYDPTPSGEERLVNIKKIIDDTDNI